MDGQVEYRHQAQMRLGTERVSAPATLYKRRMRADCKREGSATALPSLDPEIILGGFLFDYPVRVDHELLRRTLVKVLVTLRGIIE
jgi:hypothetical protein